MNNTEKRRELVRQVEENELSTYDKLVIWAMCRNGLRVGRAMKDLYYTRTALDSRIIRLKERTGFDLRDFYDAQRLLAIIGEDPVRRGINGCD